MLSRKETRTFVSLAAKAVIVCAGARLLIDILSDALPSHGDWISKGLSILAVVAVRRRRPCAQGCRQGPSLASRLSSPPMPASLDGRLVVALSSRALFDFEEENQLFEDSDDRAYMRLQQQRLDEPAKPGTAFSLVRKLLAFNAPGGTPRVEVVVLSRNDPISGMRVFRSAQHYGLNIERGVFTRGHSPWRYLKPLKAQLFLSANEDDVRSALLAGVAAARVFPQSARASAAYPDELRIAFDGDAVLFSDEAEQVYQRD